MEKIPTKVLQQALSYPAYREKINQLRAADKTTGDNHSEAMLHYTDLNISRMNRLDKTTRLTEETQTQLDNLPGPLTWLVLTEGWCGDAAQIIPVLQRMAEASDQVKLKLILRDEHPDIMDAFLTNGGRSIPKVVFLDTETQKVLGSWGPRPAAVQQMVVDSRDILNSITNPEEKKARYQELVVKAQKWYAKDKTRSIQRELLQALHHHLEAVATVK